MLYDNLENNYKLEKCEDKFGQFAKKGETAMNLAPKEATILPQIQSNRAMHLGHWYLSSTLVVIWQYRNLFDKVERMPFGCYQVDLTC